MSSKRRKTDKTGHSVSDQYAIMDYSFLRSNAVRQLSGPAIKVFLELRARFNGKNNGRITLSLDECRRLFSIGKRTAQRAFQELEAKGFVRLIVLGRWYGRKASEWQLTMLPRDGCPPTHDWKMWKPEKPLREAKKVDTRFQGGFVACFEGSIMEPRH
jgi:hypothetical protein